MLFFKHSVLQVSLLLFAYILSPDATAAQTGSRAEDSLLNHLSNTYVRNPRRAVSIADSLLRSGTITNNETLARLSLYMGASYYFLSKTDSCIIYLDTALALSKKTGNRRLIANSYNAEAIIHVFLGNYNKALQMNKAALNIYRKLKDTTAMVNSLKGISNAFFRMEQNDSAIRTNIQALKILKNRSDTTGLNYKAGLMMNIGNILIDKQPESSISYYLDAERLFNKTGNERELARLYHNLGSLYFDLKKPDTALTFLLQSVKLKKSYKLLRNLSSSLLLLGETYKVLNKSDKATKYLKEAVNTAQQVDDSYYLTLSMVTLSGIYLDRNDIDSAKIYIRKINKLKVESPYLISEIHRINSDYYQHQHNYKEALAQYKLYKAFDDTVMDAKVTKTTLELEKKYQTQLKEKKNQQLKNQLLIKQHKENQQKQYLIILVSGFLVLIMVVLLLIKLLRTRSKSIKWLKQLQKTEKEKARLEKLKHEQQIASEKTIRKLQEEKHRQEIELSNRKLATLAMQIMNKNQILREIETKLKTADNQNSLRNINNLIKTSFNFDKNWDMLKKHFEKVHPGFFTSLKNKYPNLTDYDLRLAAYLKINLTTKEIAQIINVTPAAINKSRQRLRKKMNLPGEVDFREYFSNIG